MVRHRDNVDRNAHVDIKLLIMKTCARKGKQCDRY